MENCPPEQEKLGENSLKVTIEGPVASGKTALAIFISDALMLAGFNVRNIDIDCVMHNGVYPAHLLDAKQTAARLNSIVKKCESEGPIVVETKQTRYKSRSKTKPLLVYINHRLC